MNLSNCNSKPSSQWNLRPLKIKELTKANRMNFATKTDGIHWKTKNKFQTTHSIVFVCVSFDCHFTSILLKNEHLNLGSELDKDVT